MARKALDCSSGIERSPRRQHYRTPIRSFRRINVHERPGLLLPTFSPSPSKASPRGWRKSLISVRSPGGRCRVRTCDLCRVNQGYPMLACSPPKQPDSQPRRRWQTSLSRERSHPSMGGNFGGNIVAQPSQLRVPICFAGDLLDDAPSAPGETEVGAKPPHADPTSDGRQLRTFGRAESAIARWPA